MFHLFHTHGTSGIIMAADANQTPPAPSAPAVSPSPSAGPEGQASAHLEHRLSSRWEDLVTALNSSHFYIELGLAIVAIIMACIVASYINRKIMQRFAASPPRRIDPEFLLKPLLLLSPTLAVMFLGATQAVSIAAGLSEGGLTGGIIELAYAWWLTKCVFMAIRQRIVADVIAAAIIINAVLRAIRIAHVVSTYLDSVAFDFGTYHITILHILHGIVIFVVMFWAAGLVSRALESYLRRNTRFSPTTLHLTVKFCRTLIYICAFAVTLSAVGIDLTAFAIFTGALGVGVGLGLQKLTANFFSGVTVMMERSVKIGDLIEIGQHTGWVRELNMRYALIETENGRDILIPNEELVSSQVVNWTLTSTMARIEIPVAISLEGDAVKAKELLLAAAREHPRCLREPQPTCWLKAFGDHGLEFRLTFWISDVKEGRSGPQSDVMFAILEKFRQNGIALTPA